MNEKNVPVWALKPSPDLDWSGWVYPPLTVERLEQVLEDVWRAIRSGDFPEEDGPRKPLSEYVRRRGTWK